MSENRFLSLAFPERYIFPHEAEIYRKAFTRRKEPDEIKIFLISKIFIFLE
jgi:hypothetical protein